MILSTRSIELVCILIGVLGLPPLVLAADDFPNDIQWPWWRGPYSNGTAVPSGKQMAEKPRVLWHSTEFTKKTGGTVTGNWLTGGCQSLVMHDDKIYCSYFIGSQESVQLNQRRREKTDNTLSLLINGRTKGDAPDAGLKRVGITDENVIRNMAANIIGEEVMVCLDANTGETLWKTVMPNSINSTGGTYGGHFTPSVDPTTGRVYSVGINGHVYGFDGKNGDLLWTYKGRPAVELPVSSQREAGISFSRNRYEMVVAVDGVVVLERFRYFDPQQKKNIKNQEAQVALNAATGEELWTMKVGGWFWLPWYVNGKWYLLHVGKTGISCVVPASGKVLWHLKDAVDGPLNTVVDKGRLFYGTGCYRIDETGYELLWRNRNLILAPVSGGIVHNDHLYIEGKDVAAVAEARTALANGGDPDSSKAANDRKLIDKHIKQAKKHASAHILAISMQDGSLRSQSPGLPFGDTGSLLVSTDGRIYRKNKSHNGFLWLDTKLKDFGGTDKTIYAGEANPYCCNTPVAYKGRIYVRAGWSVACLDFTVAE